MGAAETKLLTEVEEVAPPPAPKGPPPPLTNLFLKLMQACKTGVIDNVKAVLEEGQEAGRQKPATPDELPPGWEEHKDAEGAIYYFHLKDRRMAKTRPKWPTPVTYSQQVNESRLRDGVTPLMVVSEHGYTDIAELLIGKGARVAQPSLAGVTPLLLACQNAHQDMTALCVPPLAPPSPTAFVASKRARPLTRVPHARATPSGCSSTARQSIMRAPTA